MTRRRHGNWATWRCRSLGTDGRVPPPEELRYSDLPPLIGKVNQCLICRNPLHATRL